MEDIQKSNQKMKEKHKVALGICGYCLFIYLLAWSSINNFSLYLLFSIIGMCILLFWMLVPNKYFYIESWKYKSNT